MAYEVLVPKFTAASFSVNPVKQKAITILTVKVTEIKKILEPEVRYSGEMIAGEE
jgi:hypothetical protein